MDDLLKDLNERQIEAVTTTEGYCRVIAGAGSGKTKTLTHRFAYLVTELGISARNILCVTFTNKAAGEMKSRVRKLLGDSYDNALITTYHGFCVKVLKEDIYKLFFPANFKILDVREQKKILEEIYAEYEIKLDYSTFEKTLQHIYREKTHLKYIPLMSDPAYIFNPENAVSLEEKIYIKYLSRQKKTYALDFNDLIYFTIYLFEHHEDIAEKWQDRLHYIQVDEFQDSSKKELDIINALCKKHNNLFVVGDPDQNIYEWRNSENRFLVQFDKNYPNVTTVILNQNYRSTPEILAVSNSLIEKNKNRVPKELFTHNQSGKKAEYIHLKSEADESKWIVSKIRELTEEKKCNYSDIAILYRSSYVSRFIEQCLTSENIPYLIYGGVRFFDRMEIRDCIAFLKLVSEDDDEAFLRVINVPRRQMGKFRIDMLKSVQKKFLEEMGIEKSLFEILCENIDENIFAATNAGNFVEIITEHRKLNESGNAKVSDLLNSLLERTGYKKYISMNGDMERFDNITELLSSITEFEQQIGEDITLKAYLQQLAVISDYESERNRNCVKLMTIHASKGLEFPYVMVAGMTDGIFPSWKSLEERREQGLEEERRLCYVAMTRAMLELYMIESEGKSHGEMNKLPSRFLFDVEPSSVDITGTISEEIKRDLSANINRHFPNENRMNLIKSGGTATDKTDNFKIGDKVRHKFFGEGEIVGIDLKSNAYLIKFNNLENPKPISRDYAGLIPLNDILIEGESLKDAKDPCTPVKQMSNFEKKLDKVFERSTVASTKNMDGTTSPMAEIEVLTDIEDKNRDKNKGEGRKRGGEGNKNKDEDENEHIKDSASLIPPNVNIPNSLYGAAPQILYDNRDRVNLWNDDSIPKKGWICVDVIDLGYPSGKCGMCGKEDIRYVHIMRHENGLAIGAGCVCAGNMEGDIELAKSRENSLKNKINRFHTFFNMKLKKSSAGNFYTTYKDTSITFLRDKYNADVWKFVEGGEFSGSFDTLEEARTAAFMKIDAGR